MQTVRFIKEPGYIYDLFFLFVLRFNKDHCLTNHINYRKSAEDTAYFNGVYTAYEDISDDLLLFFYLKDGNKCFMMQHYFEPYKSELLTTYQLSTVQEALTDFDKVVDNLMAFYFSDTDSTSRRACKDSPVLMGRLIKNSSYMDAVKSHLYAFFLEPVPFIQKLICELTEKGMRLSQQYERDLRKLESLQREFDREVLSEKYKLCKNQRADIDTFADLYISFCMVSKNCVKAFFDENRAIILLGSDYLDGLDSLISENAAPDFNAFGTAISEKNRTDILNLMLNKDEITIRDIEQELRFTGTNAYYHLSLMIKAGMVKARNQGRTVLYSLNKPYFHVIADMMRKYAD